MKQYGDFQEKIILLPESVPPFPQKDRLGEKPHEVRCSAKTLYEALGSFHVIHTGCFAKRPYTSPRTSHYTPRTFFPLPGNQVLVMGQGPVLGPDIFLIFRPPHIIFHEKIDGIVVGGL